MMEALKVLLCVEEEGMLHTERTKQIFYQLFYLSSIGALNQIEESKYELIENEKYYEIEKSQIKKSAQETAQIFVDNIFGQKEQEQFEVFLE